MMILEADKELFDQDLEKFLVAMEERLGLEREAPLPVQPPLPADHMPWYAGAAQSLADLGYGPEEPAMDPEAVKQVLAEFARDAGVSLASPLDPQVLDLAVRCTVFDGETLEVPLSKPLDKHSTGLAVRILQFRLKSLCFYNGPVTGKFNKGTRLAVGFMRSALNLNSENPEQVKPEVVHFLGDAFWIGSRLRNLLGDEPVFLGGGVAVPDLEIPDKNKVLYVKDGLFTDKYHGRRIQRPSWGGFYSGQQRFGRFFFQFQLFMSSHLVENPTYLFQANDAKALSSFLQENMVDAKKYLAFMEDGSLMMAPAALELFGTERPDPETLKKDEMIVFDQLNKLLKNEESAQPLPGASHNEDASRAHFVHYIWSKIKFVSKKAYRGVSSVLAYMKKTLCSLPLTVWRRTMEWGHAGFHVLGHVFRRGREVMQTFWSAMRSFLRFLAKGIVETRHPGCQCISFFRSNEALSFASSPERPETVYEEHITKLKKVSRAFGIACDIIGVVIQVAIMAASGSIGWLRLGVKIFKALVAVLAKYSFRELSLMEVLLT